MSLQTVFKSWDLCITKSKTIESTQYIQYISLQREHLIVLLLPADINKVAKSLLTLMPLLQKVFRFRIISTMCVASLCQCSISTKAIFVIVLWGFTAVQSFIKLGYDNTLLAYYIYGITIFHFFFVLGGWLVDMYLGHYRVTKYSLRVLWVSLIASDLLTAFENASITKAKAVPSFIGIGASACVVSNIFQLGSDQLFDASSSQITSFINWQIWAFFFAISISLISSICFCSSYTDSISLLIPATFCTVSVICDFFFSKWIVEEPVKTNPIKQIYQVLKYAAKNKYPRLRSAFTYWEDKPYSRIDLGKSKYGGPFTTEQVEDVKTFFRILLLVISSLPFTSFCFFVQLININKVYLQFDNNHSSVSCQHNTLAEYLNICYQNKAPQYFYAFFVVIFFPVARIIFCLVKCPLYCGSFYVKFLVGGVFLLIYSLLSFSLEITALEMSHSQNGTCLFNTPSGLPQQQLLNFNVNWLLLPQSFLGMSLFLMITFTNEFIAAQAPYALRGFLIGLWCSVGGISYGLATGGVIGVTKTTEQYFKTSLQASKCGVWYSGILSGFVSLLICGYLVILKCYTPRRRDEELHNKQKFAIEYFEKYISHN